MRNNSVTHRSGNKNALTFQKWKRNVVSKQEQFHFFIIIFSFALDGIFTTLDPLFCTAVYSDYSWWHYLVQPPNCAGATRTMSCLQIQSQHEHGLTPTGRGVYFLFCALLCQLNSLSIFRKREKKSFWQTQKSWATQQSCTLALKRSCKRNTRKPTNTCWSFVTVKLALHFCTLSKHTESAGTKLVFNRKEEDPILIYGKVYCRPSAQREVAGQRATCGCQNIVSPCYF